MATATPQRPTSNANRAFAVRKLPDGGVALALNLSKTGFVVKVSPQEVQQITKEIISLHKRIHGQGQRKTTSSGAPRQAEIKGHIRRAVLGLLGRRMARVAPMGLMGAARRIGKKGKKKPARRGTKKPTLSAKASVKVNVNAQALLNARKKAAAKMAAARRLANKKRQAAAALLKKAAAAKAAAVKAARAGGAKAKAEIAKKANVIRKALQIVSQRRALYLAAQSGQSRPSKSQIAEGQGFARQKFQKLGLPISSGDHPFYRGKSVKLVADLTAKGVNYLVSQGAPAKPPRLRQGKPSSAKTSTSQTAPSRQKLALVTAGIQLISQRRAKMIAYEARKNTKPTTEELKQGQAFAHQLALKYGIPTTNAPSKFWQMPIEGIKKRIHLIVTLALKLGAPAKAPVRMQLDRSKSRAYNKALSTITTRRAKFLAQQRKGGSSVSKTDIKSGLAFGRSFMSKNGVPSPDAPHVFWQQPLEVIATKLAAVVKLAEVQGAPPPAPKETAPATPPPPSTPAPGATATPATTPAPPTVAQPVATQVIDSKVNAVRQGLSLIADRRAKFMAYHRNATFPSSADIRDGKDFAKKLFIDNQVPVRLPGKSDTIIGWAMAPRYRAGMGQDALPDQTMIDTGWRPAPGLPPFPPNHPLIPNDRWPSYGGNPIPTREYQGFLWAHEPSRQLWYIKQITGPVEPTVDPITAFWAQPVEAIQRRVEELVLVARDRGAPLDPTGTTPPVDLYPPRDGAAPGEMPPPGEMGPDAGIPGQEYGDGIPGEMPPGEMPGQEYPGQIPGAYPGPEPQGYIPGEQYAPPQPQPYIPGEMPPDYSAMNIPPGEMPYGQMPGAMYPGDVPGAVDPPYGEPPYNVPAGVVPGQEEPYSDLYNSIPPQYADGAQYDEHAEGMPQGEDIPGELPEGFDQGENEGIEQEFSDAAF